MSVRFVFTNKHSMFVCLFAYSRAGSTTTKHLGAFKRWKAWEKIHKLLVFPVKAAYLVVYPQYVSETTKSKVIDLVINATALVPSTASAGSINSSSSSHIPVMSTSAKQWGYNAITQ